MLDNVGTTLCLIFAAFLAVGVAVLAVGSAASWVYLAGHYLFGAF